MSEFKNMEPLKGGEFLMKGVTEGDEMYPEGATEEHKMLAKTADDFVEKEVIPVIEDLEGEKKYELNKMLLRKAAELGLTMVDIPEQYGGLGMDKISSAIVKEKLAGNASFSATIGAHCVIGTMPILYFGTEDQKKKYLPLLATAEKISAYALTEPTAGSDAMSIKTKAELSSDGKYYILNGSKQWITNSGFADMFIVYAKIDGEKFTGFIVEKDYPGVSVGPEEKKMGLHGSSTCAVYLEDAKVPAENVLGQIGRGHKIAFNTLNLGRFSLAASSAGGCKRIIRETILYAKERKQFGQPIANFQMIKRKIADMVARTFALESIVFRIASYIESLKCGVDASGEDYWKKMVDVIEEHNIEDSAAKVYGSETLGKVIDDAIQIFGGYGYMEEYPVERPYRDARINRIFEGTNEINRLVTFGTIMRRAMKGQIPLMDFAGKATEDIKNISGFNIDVDLGAVQNEAVLNELLKRLVVVAIQQAGMKYMQKIQEEEIVIELLANAVINILALDSTIRRVYRGNSEAHLNVLKAMIEDFVTETICAVESVGRYTGLTDVVSAAREIETLLDRLGYSSIEYKIKVADAVIEAERYPFGI